MALSSGGKCTIVDIGANFAWRWGHLDNPYTIQIDITGKSGNKYSTGQDYVNANEKLPDGQGVYSCQS
jgi:hypothetical protein